MANRYWVQGTGNWSDDDNHWATSSGGSPGDGNLPTQNDDVFIDDQSGFGGGGTIKMTLPVPECRDLNFISGHNIILLSDIGNDGIDVYGSVLFESGISFDDIINGYIGLKSTTSGKTITTAGIYVPRILTEGINGEWSLLDDLSCLYITAYNGILDANGHNIIIDGSIYVEADIGESPTINMGEGTWTFTNNSYTVIDIEGYNGEFPVINSESSTVIINGSGTKIIYIWNDIVDNIITFNNLLVSGSDELDIQQEGSEIIDIAINDFEVDTSPYIIKFQQGTTTTVTTFTVNGSAGNLITLDSINGTDQFDLSSTTNIINCDYLDISNCNATGGARWYAGCHSLDTDNNDGWRFSSWLDNDDAWAFGEENTTEGETEVSWATWSDGAGGAPTITGDPDWGKLELASGEEARSLVYDMGDSLERIYALEENRYGTGQEDAVLQIRGDTVSFNQDDNEPPNWETYTCPITKTWRYVQIRETKA